MTRKSIFSLALAATLLASGCATNRTIGAANNIEVADLDELPAPIGEVQNVLGPEQVLDIFVADAPTLSGAYMTDASTSIDFPLIGRVTLAGQSSAQASQIISDRLRGRFLLDPQVRVIPKEYAFPTVSVGGQVARPGPYPALGQLTLMRAVNHAGGPSKYAQLNDVLVLRTVRGQRYIGVYNLEAIQRGNYSDPTLYPNDVVMVGDSPGRRRIENLLQFVPLLTSSIILVDRVGGSN